MDGRRLATKPWRVSIKSVTGNHMPVFDTVLAAAPDILPAKNPTVSLSQKNIVKTNRVSPFIAKTTDPDAVNPGNQWKINPEKVEAGLRKVPCLFNHLTRAVNSGTITRINSRFDYLDLEHGLASSYILALYQDKKGNLWFGTNGEGVIRYDGQYFLQFTTGDGLPNNWVHAITEDAAGNLWFGTDGGVATFDGFNFYWIEDKSLDKLQQTRLDVRCLLVDDDGNLWIGTLGFGLFKYDSKSLTQYWTNQGVGSSITDLYKQNNGSIWFSSSETGAFKIDGDIFYNYTMQQGMISNTVNCITGDRNGNLWFGTKSGISKFDFKQFEYYDVQQGLCNNNVKDIIEDRAGNLWMATVGKGCCMYNRQSFFNYDLEEGFISNLVECMLLDNDGNLLFGTHGSGVAILTNNQFAVFGLQSAINQSPVWTINEDNEGNIWFGCMNGSIIKYDGDAFFSYNDIQEIKGERIRSIVSDKEGMMWFGCVNGGLFKYDGKRFYHYSPRKYPMLNQVMRLYVDKVGNIWIGTNKNGISKFDGKRFIHFNLNDRNGKGPIWSVYEDSMGNMWFGTHTGLLVKYNGRDFVFYNFPENGVLYNILEDRSNSLWVASSSQGLLHINDTIITSHKVVYENNARIASLVKDNDNGFWIGTSKGLEWYQHAVSSTARLNHYSFKSGLSGNEFQRNAAFVDSHHRLWWGISRGVTMLDLANMHKDTTVPLPYLSHISVNGREIDFHSLPTAGNDTGLPNHLKKINYKTAKAFYNYPINPSFPYYFDHITFYFNAINWSSPGNIAYSYKVEGLDEEWNDVSPNILADYRNIPYGDYVFKVKAIGASQKWSNAFAYPFTITRPWWHTWWFRAFLIFLAMVGIYAYMRYRTAALRVQQRFLQNTVEQRTDQLRASLKEKDALMMEIHHRVKNNLEVVSSLLMLQSDSLKDETARAALAQSQSRVQAIALIHHKLYKNESLASVDFTGFVNDLYKQVHDIFIKPGTDIFFNLNAKPTQLDVDTAIPLGLILNELITNSFKYAIQPDRPAEISISLDTRYEPDHPGKPNERLFMLIYRDNGPGLPGNYNVTTSSSLGMQVIQLLAKQIGGNFHYYNQNGAVFEIPFKTKSIVV